MALLTGGRPGRPRRGGGRHRLGGRGCAAKGDKKKEKKLI